MLSNVKSRRTIAQENGFTIVELIIALLLIGVIFAIAVPQVDIWYKSAEVKSEARNIFNLLREVRSLAMETSYEHRIEFDSETGRYRVVRGDRMTDSSVWDTVVYDWIKASPGITVDSNVSKIHMNPFGTANGGTITIKDESNAVLVYVKVASSGRIRIP